MVYILKILNFQKYILYFWYIYLLKKISFINRFFKHPTGKTQIRDYQITFLIGLSLLFISKYLLFFGQGDKTFRTPKQFFVRFPPSNERVRVVSSLSGYLVTCLKVACVDNYFVIFPRLGINGADLWHQVSCSQIWISRNKKCFFYTR